MLAGVRIRLRGWRTRADTSSNWEDTASCDSGLGSELSSNQGSPGQGRAILLAGDSPDQGRAILLGQGRQGCSRLRPRRRICFTLPEEGTGQTR